MKKTKVREQINIRLIVTYLLIAGFSTLVLGQIFYLQTFRKETLKEKANTIKPQNIEAGRGDILDIKGRVLATSVPKYRILIDTDNENLPDSVFNADVDSLAICLANLFGDHTKEAYLEGLQKAKERKYRYYLLESSASFPDLQKLKSFPILRRGRFKGGLIVEEQYDRVSPHGQLALRTIGYTNESDNRKVGIEGAYDEFLSGRDGYKLMQRISGGSLRELNYSKSVEPINGIDLISTIDINIQDVVDKALRSRLIKHDAEYGTAILMEVKTGEIRAMVNLTKDTDSVYIEDFNYAIARLYEPGSTFKLASMIVSIEKGNVELDEVYDTKRGIMKVADFTIRDHKRGGYGKITVQEIFEHSSNIGVSLIASEQFKDDPYEFIDRLYSIGFGDKLGIKLKGEPKPEIKYPDDKRMWSGVSLMQMAQGYELKVTPLQILSLFNAVANNGKLLRPIFVKNFREHGEISKPFKAKTLNSKICSGETLAKVRLLLEGVVERGTAAKYVKSEIVKIAGKTGTSEIAVGTQGYHTDEGVFNNASFAGYFPAENPKYSCIVLISKPRRFSAYGGSVAGPVFKEIAEKLYATDNEMQKDKIFEVKNMKDTLVLPTTKYGNKNLLNAVFYSLNILTIGKIEKEYQWVKTSAQENKIGYSKLEVEAGKMPNVFGMGARDAVFMLENMGLKVIIKGRGTVVKQSIPPAKEIKQNQKVVLTLEL